MRQLIPIVRDNPTTTSPKEGERRLVFPTPKPPQPMPAPRSQHLVVAVGQYTRAKSTARGAIDVAVQAIELAAGRGADVGALRQAIAQLRDEL